MKGLSQFCVLDVKSMVLEKLIKYMHPIARVAVTTPRANQIRGAVKSLIVVANGSLESFNRPPIKASRAIAAPPFMRTAVRNAMVAEE